LKAELWSLGTGSCSKAGLPFSGLSFVEPFKNLFVMDATTNWNEETVSLLKDLFDLPPKDKALLILLGVFGLQKTCTPKTNALQLLE
jgi:hypothetical protein